MTDKLYLYEAIELRAEYGARIQELKTIAPGEHRRGLYDTDSGGYKAAEGFNPEALRVEVKKLEAKLRLLNNAVQRTNFATEITVDGETLNLLEALELRKAAATEIAELAGKLPGAAYIHVIHKEDRDIEHKPEVVYTAVREKLEAKRLAFRALNRALRKAAFDVTVKFRDEAEG